LLPQYGGGDASLSWQPMVATFCIMVSWHGPEMVRKAESHNAHGAVQEMKTLACRGSSARQEMTSVQGQQRRRKHYCAGPVAHGKNLIKVLNLKFLVL